MGRKIIFLEFKPTKSCPLHWLYKETYYILLKQFSIANNNNLVLIPSGSSKWNMVNISEILRINKTEINNAS